MNYFLIGFLKVRIGNNAERLNNIPKYITEFCAKKKEENAKLK